MNRILVFPALIAVLAFATVHAQADEHGSDALKAAIIGGVVVGGAALVLKPHHHKHHEVGPRPDHRFDQGMSYPRTIPLAPGPVILPHAIGTGVEGQTVRPGPVGSGVSPQSSSPIGTGVSPRSGSYQSQQPDYDPYNVK
ncbi:hypothetical protein [Brucella pituitosa]|uniref:hypothetical protein n=1 Tax=Brucella pituitosa TaxID=571256 RepID=UPI0009A24746|nr:hypothetical protein [Brucella pituitosa]